MTAYKVRLCKACTLLGLLMLGFWKSAAAARFSRVQLLQNWSEKGQPNAGERGLCCANSKELDIKCQ